MLERVSDESHDEHPRRGDVAEAPAVALRDPGRIMTSVAKAADSGGVARAARDARTALRDAASAAAEAAVRARLVAAALDETLAVLAATGDAPALPPQAVSSPTTYRLSARETEVLVLVAEGRSNKAIAEALFVSPNTVKTHVASLLNKLHADNRAQLAAIATTRGFLPSHPTSSNSHHDTVSR